MNLLPLSIVKTLSLFGVAALSVALVGCGNASFAGPPQGSNTSGRGLEPLLGATPFTFAPEVKEVTGFAVDQWFINPGSDSNDQFLGQLVAWADGIDALKNGGFRRFVTTNASAQSSNPLHWELNMQFPMVMSFMCQWYYRNADNTRPTVFDVFGRKLFSDAALDISFTTSPAVEVFNNVPELIAIRWDEDYPSRGPVGVDVPLKGWTTPPTTDPAAFPQPFQTFTATQYNTLGMIVVQQVTAGVTGVGGGATAGGAPQLSLGAPIADSIENSRVESIMSVPLRQAGTGAQIAVRTPVGFFADNFAIAYRLAPVKQAPQIDLNAIPPRSRVSINDVDLEEALIEFSRHMAAVHANIVGQAVGLSPAKPGTIMDPALALMQNRYEYRFDQEDVNLLATTCLPGRFR